MVPVAKKKGPEQTPPERLSERADQTGFPWRYRAALSSAGRCAHTPAIAAAIAPAGLLQCQGEAARGAGARGDGRREP